MLVFTVAIIIGFIVLVWSADRFTDGASELARAFGVSQLVIGLTVVAIGSSAPEIMVSFNAALVGAMNLAIGNAVGSNITNVSLVLGATAMVVPIAYQRQVIQSSLLILTAAMVAIYIMFSDGRLDFIDGAILLGSLTAYSAWLVQTARKDKSSGLAEVSDGERADGDTPNLKRAIVWVLVGGVLLPLSARLLVWGASGIAEALGVSDLVIGLTIVALGTSLPELAASIAGALKGEHEMVVGNIIGSNVFNIMAVLGVPGLISPGAISTEVLGRDLPVMVAVVVLLVVLMFLGRKNQQLGRISGIVLLCSYLAYLAEVIRQSSAV